MIRRPTRYTLFPYTSSSDLKRKAKTEEEKEARAYERTMRNRRAAQESRDRKKRQLEALEEENRRLQQENEQMKKRIRSEEHTSELQSPDHIVCRLLLEKKKT